jgi:hypothetical protein
MPEEKPDDVEKVLSELKSVEDRKQAVIDDLLRQKAEAVKAFDEKLAKLGYHANAGKPRRSHHKAAATAAKTKPPKEPVAPAGGGGKVNAPTVPRKRR